MMTFLAGYSALLQPSYWFNPNPVPLGPSLAGGMFAFFAWFMAAGVAFWLLAAWFKKRDRLKRQVADKLATTLFWPGLFAMLALFSNYEQIPLFGMRFWFLPAIVMFLYWLIRAVIYMVRDVPKERMRLAEKERVERWLPKKK